MLSIIRVLFAVYFFASLIIVLWNTKDYFSLLQISRWAFLIEAIYFLQAARQSFRGKNSYEHEAEWKLIHVLYEIAFSFQLFNFVYYLNTIIVNFENLNNMGMEFYIEAQLQLFGFVVIWCDQLFNLIRFSKRHVGFIALLALGNVGMISAVKAITGRDIYREIDFESTSGNIVSVLMVVLPIVHFVIGYVHYEYKHKTRNNRRKLLTDQLVALRKVPVGTIARQYPTL